MSEAPVRHGSGGGNVPKVLNRPLCNNGIFMRSGNGPDRMKLLILSGVLLFLYENMQFLKKRIDKFIFVGVR